MYANCMQIIRPLVAVILDKRRTKKSELYPVKLRITFAREQRYYALGIDLSAEDFELIQGNSDFKKVPDLMERRRLQEARRKVAVLTGKAYSIVDGLPAFSFKAFDRLFNDDYTASREEVFPFYMQVIQRLEAEGRISTASNYRCSMHSLLEFRPKLKFRDITVDFLKSYEKWLIEKGRSISTVGVYLRPLRAILNFAIEEGAISRETSYPFGGRQYKIPATRNIKKALTKEEIKLIFDYRGPKDSWWQKARDFFVLSYLCNGMNMKDILTLRNCDIDGDYIRFIRSKTVNSNKSSLKPISIFISDEVRDIIKRYRKNSVKPTDYIFPFLHQGCAAIKMNADIQQFIKMMNKYLADIAKSQGIDKKVTTYFARHSFATVLKRSGVSTEVISESLGHSSLRTTSIYLDSFDDEVKKDISKILTNSFGNS